MLDKQVQSIESSVKPLLSAVANHQLFEVIEHVDHLRFFASQHMFCAWDFMSLLVSLFNRLVPTSLPWQPPTDPESANIICKLMSEEQCDVTPDGTYSSHFGFYLGAIDLMNVYTAPIRELIQAIASGEEFERVVGQADILQGTKQNMLVTHAFLSAETHEIAAALSFGREAITCSMFSAIIRAVKKHNLCAGGYDLSKYVYYCSRHIELDGEQHFHESARMVSNLIHGDDDKLEQARLAARKALEARIEFFDDMYSCIVNHKVEAMLPAS